MLRIKGEWNIQRDHKRGVMVSKAPTCRENLVTTLFELRVEDILRKEVVGRSGVSRISVGAINS